MEQSLPAPHAVRAERMTRVGAFRERASPFLCRDEARHNLLLGILTNLDSWPSEYPDEEPQLWMVTRGSTTVGVAVMTSPYNIVVSELADPVAAEVLAQSLGDANIAVPGVVASVPAAEQFATAWERHTGQAMECEVRQGIYSLSRVTSPAAVEGRPRQATEHDRDLLHEWIASFGEEIGGRIIREWARREVERRLAEENGGYHLWEAGGTPVSLVGFGGFTPNGVRIGPVYTPPDHRGAGYASALVAHASQQCLDAGRRFCFLYTDLANPTSNGIYRRIGYELVCESEQWGLVHRGGLATR